MQLSYKRRQPLGCIQILIPNYNFPTTRSNKDDIILKAIVITTQLIYDSQQDTRQECEWLELSKLGSVTMNTRSNQEFAQSSKHKETGGRIYQQ
jgi:hypothetical protein